MRGENKGKLRRRDGISEATVRRLSNYYRVLEDLAVEGRDTVSSKGLAERCGTTSAQVRKDFSSFGSFGRRGLGYQVESLRNRIVKILGIDHDWNMVLIGAGNLGHALFHYEEFRTQGFYITAIFDADPEKVGGKWEGVEIRAMAELKRVVEEQGAKMGVIAVPQGSGQDVADRLVAAGIEGILNFSPKKLKVPGDVYIRNVNLSVALEGLSYSLSKKRKLPPF